MGFRPGKPAKSEGKLLASLAHLSVTLCTNDSTEAELLLVRTLQRTRARVVRIWPLPSTLTAETDVLFCEYAPDLPSRLPWLPGEPRATLIILLPQTDTYDLGVLYSCAPDAVLYRPYQSHSIIASLILGRSQFLYHGRLHDRVARLDESLRASRDIERAKQIIMEQDNIGEDAAYRALRQLAMSRRATIAEIASRIVDSSIPATLA
jgi:AmiR/NasT family two-component response regulator